MTLLQAAAIVRRLARGERRRHVLGAAALFTLPAVAAILLALWGKWGGGIFDELLEVDLSFLAPFAAASLFAAAIADELDRGTAGFLFVRPAPRAALLVGRLTAALPTLLGTAAASLVVGFVALYARFPGDLPGALPHLLAALAAVLGALLLYSLLALGLGASFRARPVATVLVLFLVDAGLAHIPVALRLLAPAHHLRTLAGLPDGGTLAIPFTIPLWGSALYLLALLALAAKLGLSRVDSLEMTGETA